MANIVFTFTSWVKAFQLKNLFRFFFIVFLLAAPLFWVTAGDLDSGFGSEGLVQTRLGYGTGTANVIVQQADGKLIVGGDRTLVRMLTDGTIDPTFGDGGYVTTLLEVADMALQTNGKIVVSGAVYRDGSSSADFGVARYTGEGQLDSTFNGGETLRLSSNGATLVSAKAIALQADDKIIVLGYLPHGSNSGPVLVRLLPSGELDNSFDGDGKRFLDDMRWVFSLLIQPDDKILVGGNDGGGSGDTKLVLARYQANGALDTAFANDGTIISHLDMNINTVSDMVLQPDGKIVAAVEALYGIPSQVSDFAIVRFLPNGVLDTTFSNDGKIVIDYGSDDYANEVTLQADGKIVATGVLNMGTDGYRNVLIRLKSNGDLDTTFDGDGILFSPYEEYFDSIEDVLVQNDGKIVAPGSIGRQMAVARYFDNGSLDMTFGNSGEVTCTPGNSVANALILQLDGKIVVGGYTGYQSGSDWTLLRYDADGILDTDFDGDGIVMTTFFGDSAGNRAQALALQPDGKIVAAGKAFLDVWPYGRYGLGLVRYHPDGSLDVDFADNGKLSQYIDINIEDENHALTIQSDGKILVAGEIDDAFAVVRFNSDGTLDEPFGVDGIAIADFDNSATAYDIAIQPDGKIVVVGQAYIAGEYTNGFGVARFQSNGILDSNFGTDGKVTATFFQGKSAYAVVIQDDGKILVGGEADSDEEKSNSEFALLRYNENGTLDATFGNGGRAFTGWQDYSLDGIRDLSLLVDGKILAVGNTSDWYNGDMAMARYNTNGTLDKSFSYDGKVHADFGATNDRARAIAVQSDGKIVIAGSTYYTLAIARFDVEDVEVKQVFLPVVITPD